nr:MAG TPA: hypothetical protein [Caudoviricetes sp.]
MDIDGHNPAYALPILFSMVSAVVMCFYHFFNTLQLLFITPYELL